MERLTKISEIGNAYYPKCFKEPCCGMGECLDDKCNLMLDACEKLAEYEQLEEQGLLVRLPVPIGTIVYCIYTSMTGKNATILSDRFTVDMCKHWGTFVFATEEEAEKKLKEMN